MGHLSGDGAFTAKCHTWLENEYGCERALMTHSCTGALEIAAILADLKRGDEVIMPSYTFVSTANAFALRGAVPVFVDVRSDTLNLDETRIEQAISERTRAIVAVHYAGVACEMNAIMAIAEKHGLLVIEDAAQGIFSTYKGRPLGSIGNLGTLSFHETKNIHSGEGGALLVNDPSFSDRAEVIREKGTNRKAFFRGVVDKYTWVDIGSSYLPSDMVAAYLWAQIGDADRITRRRHAIWQAYHAACEDLEAKGRCRRPTVPADCGHNAHIYYLLLPTAARRSDFIRHLADRGVQAVFHYVPLHSSPMGRKMCRTVGPMTQTDDIAARLVRLPVWLGIEDNLGEVIGIVRDALNGRFD
jgi:dTDP-4-amino-4,6-dideoxygalactose transaminase